MSSAMLTTSKPAIDRKERRVKEVKGGDVGRADEGEWKE